MQSWRLIKSPPSDGFTNMAVDEAILKSVSTKKSPPTIRFYTWAPPAVSVGYFQNSVEDIDMAACREMGVDVVRRSTGGRAVLHDMELTYSVICPDNAPQFPPGILGTYKTISSCLVEGLRAVGIGAFLTPHVKKKAADAHPACFNSSSHYEITVNGNKLVGSAQRRAEGTFLQHGSVLIEFDREKLKRVLPGSGVLDGITAVREHSQVEVSALISSLVRGFEEGLGITLFEGPITDEEVAFSRHCREERYSTQEWNFGRALTA